MATYFNQEDIEAAIDERVNALQETLTEKIDSTTQTLSSQISALQTAVKKLQEKVGD